MEKSEFIKKEVAEILEMNPSKVQYYTDKGLIIPEVNAPSGRGTRRIYSKRNLLEILIAERLIEKGISLNDAESAMFMIKKYMSQNEKELLEKFWGLDEWDFNHNAFVYLLKESYIESDSWMLECTVIFFEKEHDIKLQVEFNQKTQSVYLINVTDLIERLAKL